MGVDEVYRRRDAAISRFSEPRGSGDGNPMTTQLPEERQAAAGRKMARVLVVKLETGDELEIDAGTELESARAQLASFYSELDTHKFVRFDGDTVIRSSQIAYLRLRERTESSGSLGAVKSRIGGGDEMSIHGTGEQGGTIRVPSGGDRIYGPQRRSEPLFDTNRGSETKPFFVTSEFLLTVGVIAGIAIAMSQLDNFNADRGWLLITIAAAAYVVSRGIAKAGSRSQGDDPRERIGWGGEER